jgi:DNA-binding response OmpR family regulator
VKKGKARLFHSAFRYREKENKMTITKILVVDDDPDILEPIRLLLEGEGYTVETTTKGDHTYQIVKTFRPDLILLDILMSGSDGRTICRTLKEAKETKHIPIVMMSAHPGADADSKKSGADDFVAKPFELDELTDAISKNLHRSLTEKKKKK